VSACTHDKTVKPHAQSNALATMPRQGKRAAQIAKARSNKKVKKAPDTEASQSAEPSLDPQVEEGSIQTAARLPESLGFHDAALPDLQEKTSVHSLNDERFSSIISESNMILDDDPGHTAQSS